MAVRSSRLGAAAYSPETTFGDTSETTFATRVPLLGTLDFSTLTWEKVDVEELTQYQNNTPCLVKGVKNGEFTLRMPLTGLDGLASGAITGTDVGTLLGLVIGNSDTSNSGTTAAGVPTVNVVDVAAGPMINGSLIRFGEIGDTRGQGLAGPVLDGETVPTTINLAQDLVGAPIAADVVYAMQMVYPNESPDQQALTSTRWLLQSANEQVMCWGCFPTGVTFSNLNPGELPEVSVTFAVAAWTKVAETFPTTLPVATCAQAPVAAGALIKNDFDDTTAGWLNDAFRTFELTVNLETQALLGPGSTDANVNIIGAVRTKCMAEFSYTLDSEDAGTDTPGDEWQACAYKQITVTLSASEGKSLAFYFPKCQLMGSHPMQSDLDGLNRRVLNYRCFTRTELTDSELTLSNFRIGIG